MAEFTIKKITRKTAGFYEVLGPLFGSRKVAKEVGINLYDDEDKTWYVVSYGSLFAGCCSLRGRVVSDCYVDEKHRKQGVFRAMLISLLLDTTGRLRANCTEGSLPTFISQGFKQVSATKNFTLVELDRA